MESCQEGKVRLESSAGMTPACRHALRMSFLAGSLCWAAVGQSQTRSFAAPEAPVAAGDYGVDLLPQDDKSRAELLKATAFDAKTFALYPNPLRRYLVSDRTHGLKIGRDGSVTIHIQRERRSGGNWLPAPAGPFFVVLRAYGPRLAMLHGQWLPPTVAASGDAQ